MAFIAKMLNNWNCQNQLKNFTTELNGLGTKPLNDWQFQQFSKRLKRIVENIKTKNLSKKDRAKLYENLEVFQKQFHHLGFMEDVQLTNFNEPSTSVLPLEETTYTLRSSSRKRKTSTKSEVEQKEGRIDENNFSDDYWAIKTHFQNFSDELKSQDLQHLRPEEKKNYQSRFGDILNSISSKSFSAAEFRNLSSYCRTFLKDYGEWVCVDDLRMTQRRNEKETTENDVEGAKSGADYYDKWSKPSELKNEKDVGDTTTDISFENEKTNDRSRSKPDSFQNQNSVPTIPSLAGSQTRGRFVKENGEQVDYRPDFNEHSASSDKRHQSEAKLAHTGHYLSDPIGKLTRGDNFDFSGKHDLLTKATAIAGQEQNSPKMRRALTEPGNSVAKRIALSVNQKHDSSFMEAKDDVKEFENGNIQRVRPDFSQQTEDKNVKHRIRRESTETATARPRLEENVSKDITASKETPPEATVGQIYHNEEQNTVSTQTKHDGKNYRAFEQKTHQELTKQGHQTIGNEDQNWHNQQYSAYSVEKPNPDFSQHTEQKNVQHKIRKESTETVATRLRVEQNVPNDIRASKEAPPKATVGQICHNEVQNTYSTQTKQGGAFEQMDGDWSQQTHGELTKHRHRTTSNEDQNWHNQQQSAYGFEKTKHRSQNNKSAELTSFSRNSENERAPQQPNVHRKTSIPNDFGDHYPEMGHYVGKQPLVRSLLSGDDGNRGRQELSTNEYLTEKRSEDKQRREQTSESMDYDKNEYYKESVNYTNTSYMERPSYTRGLEHLQSTEWYQTNTGTPVDIVLQHNYPFELHKLKEEANRNYDHTESSDRRNPEKNIKAFELQTHNNQSNYGRPNQEQYWQSELSVDQGKQPRGRTKSLYLNRESRNQHEHDHFSSSDRIYTKYPSATSQRRPAPPPPEPEPAVEAKEEPLQILDVHQYFRDDFDLNSLDSLDEKDRIESIKTYATSFATKVNTFDEEKYSLEYFVLDEKLMRLIEKLDKIKCQDDQTVTDRKVKVIEYIKGLHSTLDQRAKED